MKHLVVFTMKGCPHCGDFKTMLEENNITFYEHDIDEHNEEYEMFVQITENEFVPAFMVIEEGGNGCSKREVFALMFASKKAFISTLPVAVPLIYNALAIPSFV